MIYSKKIEPEYFEDVVSGAKPFEVRREDDCVFEVGDFLALNEYEPDVLKEYTGRCCLAEITYVLRDPRFVADGFAILGIRPCAIGTSKERASIVTERELYTIPVYKGGKRFSEAHPGIW